MKGIILAVTASAFLIGCGSGPDVELEWGVQARQHGGYVCRASVHARNQP